MSNNLNSSNFWKYFVGFGHHYALMTMIDTSVAPSILKLDKFLKKWFRKTTLSYKIKILSIKKNSSIVQKFTKFMLNFAKNYQKFPQNLYQYFLEYLNFSSKLFSIFFSLFKKTTRTNNSHFLQKCLLKSQFRRLGMTYSFAQLLKWDYTDDFSHQRVFISLLWNEHPRRTTKNFWYYEAGLSKALERHKCGHTPFLIARVVNKLWISFIPMIISYGG